MIQVIKCLCGVLGVAAVGEIGGAMSFFQKMVIREEPIGVSRPFALLDARWKQYLPQIKKEKNWLRTQKPESVHVHTEDGLILRGMWLEAPRQSRDLVIGIHGYRGRGENDFAALAHFYHDRGFHVLMVDQRAHGCSEGKYIGFGVLDHKDLKKWIQFGTKRLGEEGSIYLHGISTGAAAAILMTGEIIPDSVKGIIADSGFTSPMEIFKHLLSQQSYLPTFLTLQIMKTMIHKHMGYELEVVDIENCVKETEIPILFIHGDNDQFAPIWMGQKMYKECVGEKMFLMIKGAGHGEGYYKAPEQYQRALDTFIEKCEAYNKPEERRFRI